ncbi:hypothetical protein Mapa_000215 [Marchantia paleacea]|nr:hypothetical protein Mapa_000215 [Marchantia paleacea]
MDSLLLLLRHASEASLSQPPEEAGDKVGVRVSRLRPSPQPTGSCLAAVAFVAALCRGLVEKRKLPLLLLILLVLLLIRGSLQAPSPNPSPEAIESPAEENMGSVPAPGPDIMAPDRSIFWNAVRFCW